MGSLHMGPILVAVVIIVLRIVLEENGASTVVTNILGVNWLYFLVGIYFAVNIANQGAQRPYKTLLKESFKYALVTRIMVGLTYSLAYAFSWGAVRFSAEGGGGVGQDSALMGYLGFPAFAVLVGTVFSIIFCMLTGSITLLIKKKNTPAEPATG